jgi:hypothetical protein
METKPSSFKDDFLAFPFDPHDVTSPMTSTHAKIILNSFIVRKVLTVKSHR